MKVVQLGPYPPPHGGVQTNLVSIRDYVKEHGVSCAVINITRHRKPEADQVYYPSNASELIWDLVRGRYDVVHLHVGGALPTRVLALALVCASIPWAKSVFTFHSGGYPSSAEGKLAKPGSFLGFVLRRFDRLIGVNREIVAFFQHLGVPPSRTRLIAPHSVSQTAVADTLTEPLASFFRDHAPVLLTVGLLEPEYDLGRQIQVLGGIRAKFPNAGLAIIGSGSLEQQLRQQIDATAYPPHVLLCGDVPHDVTLRAIADCAILLRTTLYDGDAVSVREARHFGTPVIATDNGMRPESVELISVADSESLLAAILKVLALDSSPRPLPRPPDRKNLQEVLELYRELAD